jgi:hypothetical protein
MDIPGRRTSASHRDDQAAPIMKNLVTAPGSGARCEVCQQTIEVDHVEVRCSEGPQPAHEGLRFHQWCYYAKSAQDSVSRPAVEGLFKP